MSLFHWYVLKWLIKIYMRLSKDVLPDHLTNIEKEALYYHDAYKP